MSRRKVLSISQRALIAAATKRRFKILPIIIAFLGVTIGFGYTTTVLYNKFGSFTIAVDPVLNGDGYGIALLNHRDSKYGSALITCKENKSITNISSNDLRMDQIGKNDGEDHGEDYLCYTFYVKNTGEKVLSYNEYFVSITATLGIEEAVRIRVCRTYYNGSIPWDECERTWVDYACASSTETPEEGTTAFEERNVMVNNDINTFNPGDIMKYTIVLWLEGDDPECVDDIIGGEFKMDMTFSIINQSVEEN